MSILFRETEQTEHLVLKFSLVDTYGAASELVAVDHHVVGSGTDIAGVGVELVDIVEEREVDDPKAREFLRVAQTKA